tara:strand:- start:93772 stop:94866 length:1095 start_codon:yes stop_codon:yes gene_type:complete
MSKDKYAEDILAILNIARWAPSGDNAQPWSFEILDSDTLRIYLKINTENVYEYNQGQPSLLSCGALIENIRLTAANHGRACHIKPLDIQQELIKIDLSLPLDTEVKEDPLFYYIQARSVDRTPFQTKTLPDYVLEDLEDCMGRDIEVQWYASFRKKLTVASINMTSTDIRLKIPETYTCHRDVLDWNNKFSPYGIPMASTGLSRLSLIAMKWAMARRSRLNFMNRYFCGTFIPKIELDLMPGLFCDRHFMLSFTQKKDHYEILDFINAGSALQRFWLTATKHNIAMQPSVATLSFCYYGLNQQPFTVDEACQKKAKTLYKKFTKNADKPLEQIVFMGRVGYSKSTKTSRSRSIRKELPDLMHKA